MLFDHNVCPLSFSFHSAISFLNSVMFESRNVRVVVVVVVVSSSSYDDDHDDADNDLNYLKQDSSVCTATLSTY